LKKNALLVVIVVIATIIIIDQTRNQHSPSPPLSLQHSVECLDLLASFADRTAANWAAKEQQLRIEAEAQLRTTTTITTTTMTAATSESTGQGSSSSSSSSSVFLMHRLREAKAKASSEAARAAEFLVGPSGVPSGGSSSGRSDGGNAGGEGGADGGGAGSAGSGGRSLRSVALNVHGDTPLMVAVAMGQFKVVQMMVLRQQTLNLQHCVGAAAAAAAASVAVGPSSSSSSSSSSSASNSSSSSSSSSGVGSWVNNWNASGETALVFALVMSGLTFCDGFKNTLVFFIEDFTRFFQCRLQFTTHPPHNPPNLPHPLTHFTNHSLSRRLQTWPS
jgi:hypothetical protein